MVVVHGVDGQGLSVVAVLLPDGVDGVGDMLDPFEYLVILIAFLNIEGSKLDLGHCLFEYLYKVREVIVDL